MRSNKTVVHGFASLLMLSCSTAPTPEVVNVSPTSTSAASDPTAKPVGSARAPAALDRDALCGCYRWWKDMPEKKSDPCGDLPKDEIAEYAVPECLRAHDVVTDCQGYRECFTMEPGGFAKCEDDEVHSGACASCRCSKKCDVKKKDCPAGFECTLEGAHVEGQGWCAPS